MSQKWRTVRVFISSTFRDMHAERDHLVKVVFPALRERLEKYRINLIDIDLRWGVTKEEADNDQVLDLCLQLIDECRPFFIGILGERYGWVPKEFPVDLPARYGWIQNLTGRSVTELEILYGVLNNPGMRDHAFFYFRDTKALNDVPQLIRDEIYQETDPALIDKLRAMKEKISKSGFPVIDSYPAKWDAEAYDSSAKSPGRFVGLDSFGDTLEKELWEGIKAEFELPDKPPTTVETDPLAEEQNFHELFMESRLRVYVGRDKIHAQLLEYLKGEDTRPLMVTGPSGSGKSAVLARLCGDYAQEHGDAILIPHFVGASPGSTNLRTSLRRFCETMKAAYGFGQEIPGNTQELITVFRSFLFSIPEDRYLTLVIDGVNQFDKTEQPQELAWLPEQLATNVKIILSCIDDPAHFQRAHERAREMGLAELIIEALTGEERREIIQKVPSLSAKKLDEKQIDMLLSNPATDNPLYLQVALEELRGFGSFEDLEARIAEFPRPDDDVSERKEDIIQAIFIQVIARLEEDFDAGLVRQTLPLLACARRGLSERELQDLVSESAGEDDFFPVLRQLRPYLMRRGELIDFFHRSLWKAINAAYLQDPETKKSFHLRLADYFDAKDLSFRTIEELPWQLAEAKSWQRLYDLLADLSFCKAVWESNRFDVEFFWARVEVNTSFRIIDSYKPVIEDPKTCQEHWFWVSQLLSNMGHPHEAMTLNRSILKHYIDFHDPAGIVPLQNMAALSISQGNYIWSMEVLEALDRNLCELLSDTTALTEWVDKINIDKQSSEGSVSDRDIEEIVKGMLGQIALNQARVLHARGDIKGSMNLLEKAEKLFRGSGNVDGLANCLGSQAQCLLDSKGDPGLAFVLLDEAERLARQTGNVDLLAHNIGLKATILKEQGDVEQAMVLLSEAEKLLRQIGDAQGLGTTLGNEGKILTTLGKLASALARFDEAERLFRQVKDIKDLVRVLDDKARVLSRLMRWSDSLVCIEEAHQLATQLGLSEMLQQSRTLLEFVRDKCKKS